MNTLSNIKNASPLPYPITHTFKQRHLTWRDFFQDQLEIYLMAKCLKIPKNLRVLEVGSGTANAFSALQKEFKPKYLVGIDINEKAVYQARNRIKQMGIDAQVVHGDICDLPFENESFDLVIDFGTTYHVKDRPMALSEVERVLSPEGYYIHESLLAQFIAHPLRSLKHLFKFKTQQKLTRVKHAGLWQLRNK